MSKSQKYALLSGEETYMVCDSPQDHSFRRWYRKKNLHIHLPLASCIGLSLTLNAFLLIWCLYLSIVKGGTIERSEYAQLTRNISIPWTRTSSYFGKDDGATDQLWEDMSIDDGTVALEDSYVQRIGLPRSQRFPWDHNKGLYLVNGFHSLHCLKTIRQNVVEFDRNITRSEPTEHVLHCLDALRQDVLCYADDTPRYTGYQPSGSSGTGQFRKCRSWSALAAWGRANTACYRYIHPHNHTFNPLERHRFCPEGSPYIEKVEQAFN